MDGYLLVNAELDSMGGVIDSGGGIGLKTSPRRTAIEKAQAELRQEYDVRELRRRELEFLEKGGNPLDFKFGIATSHSVQSTSLTDHQAEHFLNSGLKDSFALASSPHGDSVESSGRPAVPTVSEPNTADNLLLFDSGNKSVEGENNLRYPNRQHRTSESERSYKANTNQNIKETEDSAIFRPYARRNRTKINRDSARSSSTDLVQNRGGLATSISVRRGSVDGKGCNSEAANQKDRQTTSVSCPVFANSNRTVVPKNVAPSNTLHTKVDGGPVVRESAAGSKTSLLKDEADITIRKNSAGLHLEETGEKAQLVLTSTEIGSPKAATIAGQENNSTQMDELGDSTGEKKSLTDRAAAGTESSHANNLEVDVDTERDLYRADKLDSDEISMPKASRVEGLLNQTVGELKIEDETGRSTTIISECSPAREMQMNSVKIENENYRSVAELQNEEECSDTEKKLQHGLVVPENDKKVSSVLADDPSRFVHPGKPQASVDASSCMVGDNVLSGTDVEALKHQPSSDDGSKALDTVKEDSLLEEARIIQAKRKRIAELSCGTAPVEVREKCQWDFVLEEMAWLANDFAQERLWKMTAAAQICHRVALTSQLRFEEKNQHRKLRNIASILSSAILKFWSYVEVPGELEERGLGIDKETCQESNCESGRKCLAVGVREYARRFLKYNNSSIPGHSAAPSTPDYMCDPEILDTALVDQLSEESLFYSIPSGAMKVYQISIETHLARCEKFGNSMKEEVDTSAYDAVGDSDYDVTAFDEDEVETSTYYLPGALECSKSFNLSHKKRKNLMKSHSARSYDLGADLPYVNYTDGFNSSNLMAKRAANNINVGSVPTRRVRTASRPRIVSLPVPSKTDASSGDTSSFHDEQSSLHGGSAVQKGTEVESSGNFEKQLSYDMAETSGKPKKKKKTHLGSAYDQTWHPDSSVHAEQKDHWKKRVENHFDMNGIYGPHAKKQKTTKQLVENNFDGAIALTGSIPSPAASQMSNMSNPNKSIKFIGGRDRARKIKGLKISPGEHGSGTTWSLFEDQALVVLVHDMGPNWEFISDAINSTLKIKCIYRNPSECKERHKILMDKTASDGADSAEDSGTSQSYPSTLPGIPKGSARQLFQRLQGPMEEDTLKSHFEKICLIGKKLHYRKTQNDGRDPRQIVPVHNSQVMALSQVFPNNLNGGVLTPLDLCDASTSGQDLFSLENPGSHLGLPMLNQGTPVLPTSGSNPSTPGSSGVVPGNSLPTTLGLHHSSARDGRFNVSRGPLPLDEQHRLQQSNQMSPGRNLQQPSSLTPGAVSGSGHRMVPGANTMGVSGMNRGAPMSRPGFQAIGSAAMPNTGSMLSSGMGRGNMIHQNITLDQSHVNGLTMSPGNQATEKGDAMVAVRPDRESNVGTATSTHLQSKPFVSPQSSNHSQQLPKSFSGATSSSQEQQIQLPSDNSIQGQSSPAASCNILSTSSPSVAPAVGPSNHQHLLLHQKQRNQVQAQRIAHQNHIENSDLSTKSQAERVPRVPQPVPDTTQTASMSTSKGMPQVTNDSNNIKAVGSTAVPSPNGLEPPASAASVQSAAPNVVNSSNTDSAGSDPVTALKQGLAPKHFPGGLPCQELKGLIQRQESLPTVEMRPKLPEQLTVQNQKRLASNQQSPQIEEAQELSSPKPPDTKVE
ncbi:BnaCnng21890D [Brassica napus]|uniref:BnaCnng21890D protein n=1 Tax=Brassica napus TaxID=3708 RepID=A0A078ISS1_BRANA|nr:BnaCnng21890D [Brassica napus]